MTHLRLLVLWLRQLHRGYKVVCVLIAAWSPFLLASYPALAALAMLTATAVFWASQSPVTAALPNSNLDTVGQGNQDVQT